MLDELIDYLRAALPDTRAAGSTLRQEAALARAFLAILRIRAHGRLAVEVAIPAALDDVRDPPAMLIVPLLAAGVGPVPRRSPRVVGAAGSHRRRRSRIAIGDHGPRSDDAAGERRPRSCARLGSDCARSTAKSASMHVNARARASMTIVLELPRTMTSAVIAEDEAQPARGAPRGAAPRMARARRGCGGGDRGRGLERARAPRARRDVPRHPDARAERTGGRETRQRPRPRGLRDGLRQVRSRRIRSGRGRLRDEALQLASTRGHGRPPEGAHRPAAREPRAAAPTLAERLRRGPTTCASSPPLTATR